MPVHRRSDRLERQMHAELSALIEGELDDPRIGNVVVTGVRLSGDLGHARVFVYSADAVPDHAKLLAVLRSAAGYLRRQLSQRLAHLRRIPELSFAFDTSLETGNRIEELLRDLDPDD